LNKQYIANKPRQTVKLYKTRSTQEIKVSRDQDQVFESKEDRSNVCNYLAKLDN